MSEINSNDVNNNGTESILTRLNNNKKIFRIIIYILMFLMIGGGLAAIVMSSFIPINPQGSDETKIVQQFEIPYINLVTYLCMAILGILLILYIISVIYNFKNRGANK